MYTIRMKNKLQPYKELETFYPEDKRVQKWMFSVMRRVVESYGYEEYDAPVLEPTELFTIKGSDEIISEQSYTFTDRGDRSVTMRTEMTPSCFSVGRTTKTGACLSASLVLDTKPMALRTTPKRSFT